MDTSRALLLDVSSSPGTAAINSPSPATASMSPASPGSPHLDGLIAYGPAVPSHALAGSTGRSTVYGDGQAGIVVDREWLDPRSGARSRFALITVM